MGNFSFLEKGCILIEIHIRLVRNLQNKTLTVETLKAFFSFVCNIKDNINPHVG